VGVNSQRKSSNHWGAFWVSVECNKRWAKGRMVTYIWNNGRIKPS